MILQELAQIKAQSVLVLVFSVIDELEDTTAFSQVVRQVHTLQDFLLVKSLERNHHIQRAKFETVLELVRFP